MKRTIKVPNNIDRFDLLRLIYEQLSNQLSIHYELSITNMEFISLFGDISQYYTKENIKNFLYNYKLACDYSVADAKTVIMFDADLIDKCDFDLFKEYCSKFSKGELEREVYFADYKNKIDWNKSNLKVKRIFIEDFRILDEFNMELNNNISILIGENGSGKSSILFLSAFLLASFRLYNNNAPKFVGLVEFEYTLTNGSNSRTIVLKNASRMEFKPQIKIDNSSFMDYDHSFSLYLPSDVVVSYAGITQELADLVKQFEDNYVDKIKNLRTSFSLKPFNLPTNNFYYSRPEYLSFIYLAILFADNSTAEHLNSVIKISDDEKYDCVFQFKPGTKYLEYKNKLSGKVAPKFFTELNTINPDWELVGNIAINDLFTSFKNDISPREVFDVLYYLYHNELISTVDVYWGDSCKKSLNNLSEGQKQELMTLGLGIIFDKPNTLFLLDEPDTSLHPQWQREYISWLTKTTAHGSCAIVTTHSPLMVSGVKKEQLFVLRDGKVVEKSLNTFGKPAEDLLIDYYDLDSTRNKEVQDAIDELYDMIHNDEYESDDFKNAFEQLESKIGSDDKVFSNLKLEIIRRKKICSR